MMIGKDDIETYIPQRKPMVMVDQLVSITGSTAVSAFTITEDNIFLSGGYFSEPGLLENIAQTAAIHAGFQFRRKEQDVPVGFIAAIKDLAIDALPALHTVIQTTVRIVNTVFDVTIIDGTVEQDGTILCRCEMKIFIKPPSLS